MWSWLLTLLNGLVARLPAPLQRLWHLLTDFVTRTKTLSADAHTLVANVATELDAIRHFTFQPQWRTRVINVPRLEQAVQDRIGSVTDIANRVRDELATIREKVHAQPTFNPSELEDLKILRRLPQRVVAAAEKLLGWATLILDAVVSIEQLVQDANAIVNDIREIRITIETLDVLFLPQGNPKSTVDVKYRKRQS